MTDQAEPQYGPSNIQQLSVPFSSRSVAGKINITMYANTDNKHGCGLDLIFPSTPFVNFHGFPNIKATIDCPGPSSPFNSYAQLFGWIQFVKSTSVGETGEWEMDIHPFAQDLGMPFCYWGHNPTAFDAPCRLLDEDEPAQGRIWRAQSFLCALDDAGLTKRVKVLKGTGFGWGFDSKAERGSDGSLERKVMLSSVEILDLYKEWTSRLELLRKKYPVWTFGDEATS